MMRFIKKISFQLIEKHMEPRGFASNLQRKLKLALYKANITSKNVLGIEIYDEVYKKDKFSIN